MSCGVRVNSVVKVHRTGRARRGQTGDIARELPINQLDRCSVVTPLVRGVALTVVRWVHLDPVAPDVVLVTDVERLVDVAGVVDDVHQRHRHLDGFGGVQLRVACLGPVAQHGERGLDRRHHTRRVIVRHIDAVRVACHSLLAILGVHVVLARGLARVALWRLGHLAGAIVVVVCVGQVGYLAKIRQRSLGGIVLSVVGEERALRGKNGAGNDARVRGHVSIVDRGMQPTAGASGDPPSLTS